jgi:hypothetical protein
MVPIGAPFSNLGTIDGTLFDAEIGVETDASGKPGSRSLKQGKEVSVRSIHA